MVSGAFISEGTQRAPGVFGSFVPTRFVRSTKSGLQGGLPALSPHLANVLRGKGMSATASVADPQGSASSFCPKAARGMEVFSHARMQNALGGPSSPKRKHCTRSSGVVVADLVIRFLASPEKVLR